MRPQALDKIFPGSMSHFLLPQISELDQKVPPNIIFNHIGCKYIVSTILNELEIMKLYSIIIKLGQRVPTVHLEQMPPVRIEKYVNPVFAAWLGTQFNTTPSRFLD